MAAPSARPPGGKGITDNSSSEVSNGLENHFGAFINVVGNTLPLILGLVSAPITARLLGVNGRGELGAAFAPVLLMTTIFTFGLPDALTYFIAKDSNNFRRLTSLACLISVVAGVFLTLAIVGLAPLLSGHRLNVTHYIQIASLSTIPTLFVGVLRGAAYGHKRWWLVAIEATLTSVVRVVVLLTFVEIGYSSVLGLVLLTGVLNFSGGVVYFRLRKYWSKKRSVERSSISISPMMKYGLSVWVGSVSGFVFASLDQTLLTPLSGTYQLGLYAVAVSLGQVPSVVAWTVGKVFFSVESGNPDETRLTQVTRETTIVVLFIAIIMGVVTPFLIPLLFGSAFRGAILMTEILLASTVLNVPGSFAGVGIGARGRPGLRSASLTFGAVIDIAFVFVLVPSFGGVGAAWATLAATMFYVVFSLALLDRVFSISFWRFLRVERRDFAELWKLSKRFIAFRYRRAV